MVRHGRVLTAGFLCLAGAVVLLVWLVVGGEEGPPGPVVVLSEDNVLLRRGNGLSYPARYDTPLPRGAEARLLFVRGNWLQIELAGGEVGWVPARYTVREEPLEGRQGEIVLPRP
jgi:hypothetical protein